MVKTCGTALERQVREAVRINLRGTALNKKVMYNRCKLTRMVLDMEWEDYVKMGGRVDQSEQDLQESSRLKRKTGNTGPRKELDLRQNTTVLGVRVIFVSSSRYH